MKKIVASDNYSKPITCMPNNKNFTLSNSETWGPYLVERDISFQSVSLYSSNELFLETEVVDFTEFESSEMK